MPSGFDDLAARYEELITEAASRGSEDAQQWVRGLEGTLQGLLSEVRDLRVRLETSDEDPAPTNNEGAVQLIGALLGSRRYFVLRATTPTEQAFFHFEGGRLIEAVSTNAPAGQRLGEILVAQGAIEPKALEELLSARESGGRRIGDRLLHEGRINDEQLRTALDEQRSQLIRRLAAEPHLQLAISPR